MQFKTLRIYCIYMENALYLLYTENEGLCSWRQPWSILRREIGCLPCAIPGVSLCNTGTHTRRRRPPLIRRMHCSFFVNQVHPQDCLFLIDFFLNLSVETPVTLGFYISSRKCDIYVQNHSLQTTKAEKHLKKSKQPL